MKDAADGHLVVVGTVSKSYCMTGWRVGWVIGPRALAEAATALNSHSVQGPATFSQVAAAEALTGAAGRGARDGRGVPAPPGLHPPADRGDPRGRAARSPRAASTCSPTCRGTSRRSSRTRSPSARRLLEEKAVAVVPGEGFHAPGFFRLSFATAFADLQEGARRIAEFFAEHAPAGRRR